MTARNQKKRAQLSLAQSQELQRFSRFYPGSAERFEEIRKLAPEDLKPLLSHVVELLEAPEVANANFIADQFDLTDREAQLAGFLMTGGSLSDYAKQQDVSRNTARNQLQSIFQKVGVSRQAELVSRLLEIANAYR